MNVTIQFILIKMYFKKYFICKFIYNKIQIFGYSKLKTF